MAFKLKIFVIVFLCFFILSIYKVYAVENVVDINANLMEVIDDKKTIIFTGDVVAKKGDITLYCAKLDVFYNENSETKKKEIDYMIAKGNVKIVQTNRMAMGDIAKYFNKEDIIILEGNPAKVKEKGENEVTGNKITFYLKNNRSVVEGNRPRVIFKLGE